MAGFKWRTSVVDGELQLENYSGWLQMKSSGGLPRSTRVVSFIWRATALCYRRRTTVASLKWRNSLLGIVSCPDAPPTGGEERLVTTLLDCLGPNLGV